MTTPLFGSLRVFLALGLAVTIVAGVTSCAPSSGGSPTANPTLNQTATAMPGPTGSSGSGTDPSGGATAMPEMAGQEVLKIKATGNTPLGALLDVSMDVYYPVAFDSAQGKQIIARLIAVGDTSTLTDVSYLAQRGALVQLIKLSAVDRQQEGIAWDSSTGIIPVYGPGLVDTIVGIPHAKIGANNRQQIVGAGEGYAVAAFFVDPGSGLPPITADQWATFFMFYGFLEPSDPSYYTIVDCTIQLTGLGMATPETAHWMRDTCTIGIGD